jgi:hypothetical protein
VNRGIIMLTRNKNIILGLTLLMISTATLAFQAQPVAAVEQTFFDQQFGWFGLRDWALLPEAQDDFVLRRDWSGYAQVKEQNGDAGIAAYARHEIDLSDWDGYSDLTLTVRYSATSTYSGASQVTQFRIGIMDAVSTILWSQTRRSTSTGISWITEEMTIPAIYVAPAKFYLYFGVYDSWSTNYYMKANCDYITVTGQAA